MDFEPSGQNDFDNFVTGLSLGIVGTLLVLRALGAI